MKPTALTLTALQWAALDRFAKGETVLRVDYTRGGVGHIWHHSREMEHALFSTIYRLLRVGYIENFSENEFKGHYRISAAGRAAIRAKRRAAK